jgi:hypothetical protein
MIMRAVTKEDQLNALQSPMYRSKSIGNIGKILN